MRRSFPNPWRKAKDFSADKAVDRAEMPMSTAISFRLPNMIKPPEVDLLVLMQPAQ